MYARGEGAQVQIGIIDESRLAALCALARQPLCAGPVVVEPVLQLCGHAFRQFQNALCVDCAHHAALRRHLNVQAMVALPAEGIVAEVEGQQLLVLGIGQRQRLYVLAVIVYPVVQVALLLLRELQECGGVHSRVPSVVTLHAEVQAMYAVGKQLRVNTLLNRNPVVAQRYYHAPLIVVVEPVFVERQILIAFDGLAGVLVLAEHGGRLIKYLSAIVFCYHTIATT